MAQIKDLFAKLSSDQAKLATDQKAATTARGAADAADQAVAQDQSAIVADQAAIADGLGTVSTSGYAVDVENPNADGTYNLAIKDTSPQGYHVVAIPAFTATIPTPNPAS